MDQRSKHLSSEERGVIFAEALRGTSQRAKGALLERAAQRELASLKALGKPEVP